MYQVEYASRKTNFPNGAEYAGLDILYNYPVPNVDPVTHFRASAMNPFSKAGHERMMRGLGMGPRALGPLPDEYAEEIQNQVVEVAVAELELYKFLREQPGLLVRHDDWLAKSEIKHRRLNRGGHAVSGMDPGANADSFGFGLDNSYIKAPVFATYQRFDINMRELLESRRLGAGLDLDQLRQSVYNCNEAVEDKTVLGWQVNSGNVNIAGQPTYGLRTAPNANTRTLTAAWNLAGTTGSSITGDVEAMRVLLDGDNNHKPPLALAVTKTYEIALKHKKWSDGTTTLERTVWEEIEANGDITIVPCSKLAADTVSLFRLHRDTVRVHEGQAPTPIIWQSNDGMRYHALVLSCQFTSWLDDYDGQSGVVNGSL